MHIQMKGCHDSGAPRWITDGFSPCAANGAGEFKGDSSLKPICPSSFVDGETSRPSLEVQAIQEFSQQACAVALQLLAFELRNGAFVPDLVSLNH